MKNLSTAITFLAMASIGSAQAAVPASGPITRDEVRSALAKVEPALNRRLGIKIPASSLKQGAVPVTRVEVVGEFMRVWKACEPKFRTTPRPYTVYPEVLAQNNIGPVIKDLAFLIKRGAVAPVGPLAWGPKPTLELAEFGDALGNLVHQITALSHQPSVKFTPALMKPF